MTDAGGVISIEQYGGRYSYEYGRPHTDPEFKIYTTWERGTMHGIPTPEPATLLLFGVGIAGLAGSKIRRKKK